MKYKGFEFYITGVKDNTALVSRDSAKVDLISGAIKVSVPVSLNDSISNILDRANRKIKMIEESDGRRK